MGKFTNSSSVFQIVMRVAGCGSFHTHRHTHTRHHLRIRIRMWQSCVHAVRHSSDKQNHIEVLLTQERRRGWESCRCEHPCVCVSMCCSQCLPKVSIWIKYQSFFGKLMFMWVSLSPVMVVRRWNNFGSSKAHKLHKKHNISHDTLDAHTVTHCKSWSMSARYSISNICKCDGIWHFNGTGHRCTKVTLLHVLNGGAHM